MILMKVSIITSCFNREATIGQAIESVLAQDYPDIEYIIVDGASSDGTMEVITRYGGKIARVISEPDNGMYEAVNKGIRVATGDVVGLLHSDDYFYDRHVVSRMVETLEREDADLAYGDGLYVNKDDTSQVVRDWRSGAYKRWKVRFGWLPLHPTVYVRRKAMEKWGGYDESYKIAADSDWLFRYLYESDLKVAYANLYVVVMRMGGLSTYGSALRKLMWQEDVRLYESHGINGTCAKLLKMCWKIPQFIRPKLNSGKFYARKD